MNQNLIKPKKLEPGDTVCIITPSAGIACIFPHRVENATKMFQKLGYKVVFSKHAMEMDGYVSATAQKRADDIHEAFLDKNISMIICMIGGDHSNQILKYLDFEIIKNNPKIFVGYSDISVLHYAFIQKASLQTFYGPCVMTQFGEYPEIIPYSLEYFNKATVIANPIGVVTPSQEWTDEILDWGKKTDLDRPRNMSKSLGYEWLREGQVTAPIIGGCIPSINHLIGSEYWVDPKNKILFIDIPEGPQMDKGLPVDSLDSYLSDLDNIGVFQNISGLIIGRPYHYNDEEIEKLKKIIMYYTENYDYPILFNANIGHSDPIITIPLGVEITLDSKKDMFRINESGVI